MSGGQAIDDGSRPAVRLGLSDSAFAGGSSGSVDEFLRRTADLGFDGVELGQRTVERFLEAPVPTVALVPPPEDGLALGLLELEEEVLRDSYDLARATFEAQTRQWRTRVPLAPLEDIRRYAHRVGLSLDVLHWPDLALLSDEEVEYVLRVAKTLGAGVVSTPFSMAGPRRLTPFARRIGVPISYVVDAATAGLDPLASHSPDVRLSLEVPPSAAAAPSVSFITQHAARLSHVRIRGSFLDDSARPPSGIADAGREILRAMAQGSATYPAVLTFESEENEAAWAIATDLLARCRQAIDG